MQRLMKRMLWLFFGVVALTGCASTKVFEEHSMIATEAELAAKVYFIRPLTERPLGLGDNAIFVDLDDEPLLTVSKGEFIGVSIKPANMDVLIRAMAMVGREADFQMVERKERFSFKRNQVHYVLLKKIDNEFRGLGYAPVLVNEGEAKSAIQRLRPKGDMAKQLKAQWALTVS